MKTIARPFQEFLQEWSHRMLRRKPTSISAFAWILLLNPKTPRPYETRIANGRQPLTRSQPIMARSLEKLLRQRHLTDIPTEGSFSSRGSVHVRCHNTASTVSIKQVFREWRK